MFFGYDDVVLLTYNGYILFSSGDAFLGDLSSDQNGYLYDWSDISGADILNGSAWAAGNSSVSLPTANAFGGGELSIDIANVEINPLNQLSVDDNQIDFGLVVFGDNDYWTGGDGADCYHSGMQFDVEVTLGQ